MGTKNVRLDEDVYERIKAKKRDGETFSEAIDRLTAETSILDLYGIADPDTEDEFRAAVDGR
ncbi:antitoxin VapB family protein [Halegenticoccus soli]|uniref:antitoxin VapB family protein n=1 Tax=Halegenticoccus soli TaxID=1985678 RepID=UPI000C6CB023|nr:antitoxin VapB family protein [Halegenticoccus soli]